MGRGRLEQDRSDASFALKDWEFGELQKAVVSVVICCYNGQEFIADAVESVLGQTWQEFELTIVNDGSSDDSLDRVAPYLQDARVRAIVHKANKGTAASKNTGIVASSGEYVSFLDQDDVWLPEKLELEMGFFQANPSLGYLYSSVILADQDGREIGRSDRDFRPQELSRQMVLERLFMRGMIPTSSAVTIRRECFASVGLYDEFFTRGGEQIEFVTRMLASQTRYTFGTTGMYLVTKRMHDRQVSRSYDSQYRIETELVERMTAKFPYLRHMANDRKSLIDYEYVKGLFLDRRFADAKHKLVEVMRFRKRKPKYYLLYLLVILKAPYLYRIYRALRELCLRKGK